MCALRISNHEKNSGGMSIFRNSLCLRTQFPLPRMTREIKQSFRTADLALFLSLIHKKPKSLQENIFSLKLPSAVVDLLFVQFSMGSPNLKFSSASEGKGRDRLLMFCSP